MKRKTPRSRILQLATTIAARTAAPDGKDGMDGTHDRLATLIPARTGATQAAPTREPRTRGGRFHASTLQPLIAVTILALAATAALAQTTAPAPDPSAFSLQPSALPADPGVFAPLLDGLAGNYGWLTTVLLAIGSLRLLFKPIMLVIENALKNDPAKFAAVQKFEAGPIYKAIATVLDVEASIKLPLVKPPGPPAGPG